MPKGYIITKWTEDKGLVVKFTYPDTIKVDLDDMMRIFYAHITGAGEAGNVFVRLEKTRSNVASYFTGMESENPYIINLILELREFPEIYGEELLQLINQNIVEFLVEIEQGGLNAVEKMKNLKKYLREALFLLERLENLSKEQKLAQIYNGRKLSGILKILQEGPISKNELQYLLQERLNMLISNLDILLDPFIKTDLIKQDWIEGKSDIILFLKSDFVIMRVPPENIIKYAEQNSSKIISGEYLKRVREFFKYYEPNHQDKLKITSIMTNPDIYDYIALLRERPYPLEKLPKASEDSFIKTSDIFERLEKDTIVTIIKDKKDVDWIFLLTDIRAEEFFPEYLLEKIRTDVSDNKLKPEIAIKHLNILENAYNK